jgi:hypothetical protein
MKTKYTLFRRGGVFYAQESATGKQTSLRTKDETEAKSLLNARNEAQRQPVLNLHLARAYLTASDPAFVERTWQSVMEQLQSRGKDSSRERYATVFKSSSFLSGSPGCACKKHWRRRRRKIARRLGGSSPADCFARHFFGQGHRHI